MSMTFWDRFYERVDLNGPVMRPGLTPCHVWQGALMDGYAWTYFEGKTRRAHAIVLEKKIGRPIDKGMCALHHCDNRACVNEDHIYEGTKKNNAQDREMRGRSNHAFGSRNGAVKHPEIRQGENNGRAKLTEDDVRSMRTRHRAGVKGATLAREYGLTRTTVSAILRGKLWKNVEG
jgi:hypothetical protein